MYKVTFDLVLWSNALSNADLGRISWLVVRYADYSVTGAVKLMDVIGYNKELKKGRDMKSTGEMKFGKRKNLPPPLSQKNGISQLGPL